MKYIILFLVMTFSVPDNFDLLGFAEAARMKGILLYSVDGTDSPHGHAMLQGNTLTVSLYEENQAPSFRKLGRKKMPVAGQARLPGVLSSYQSTLQSEAAKALLPD